MNREIPKLVLDFQLESNSGASRRRVTHLVHDPTLPPFADPTAETWESARRAVGRGGQGEVLLQTCTSNGPRLNNVRALKVVRCLDGDERRRHIRELETMVRFSHERYSKSFVRMLGWYISKGKGDLCIAMEYLHHGDLHSFIQNRPPLDEPDAKQVMSQVLHGLSHMHKAGFAHMDVKPQNILIYQHPSSDESSSWWIKLSDFGISKNLEASVSVVGIGTRDYMAPELFHPSAKASDMDLRLADMWSVGVTTFYLLTKEKGFREWRSSFGSFGGQKTLDDVPKIMGSQQRQVSAEVVAFVLEMTNETLTERLRWMDALSHAWTRRYGKASSGLPAEEEEDQDEGSSVASWSSLSSLGVTDENFGRGLTTIQTALSQTTLQESRPATVALAAGSGTTQSLPSDGAMPGAGVRKEIVAPDDDAVVQAYESATGIKVGLSNPNSEAKESGHRQLFTAAREGHLDMVKLLIRKGAIVDQTSGGKSALRAAAERGHVEVVSFLAGWGASVSMPGPDRLLPLMAAANLGHADVVRLLVNLGANVEARDPKGKTALSHAVVGDSLDAAEALLQLGADFNTSNDTGEVPLYLATMQANPAMMEILLRAGADVNARNNYGLTPIFLAGCGTFDDRIKLLARYGANIFVHTTTGFTPLHMAARHGSVDMVRTLVELGCDPFAVDHSGSTVLDVAREEPRQDIVEYLEKKTAERNAKQLHDMNSIH